MDSLSLGTPSIVLNDSLIKNLESTTITSISVKEFNRVYNNYENKLIKLDEFLLNIENVKKKNLEYFN